MIAVAVLVGIAPAATVGTGPAHAVADCDFEFTYSRPTVLPYAQQIQGSGWTACADVPPDLHHLTIALEYENGGRWEVASSKTDDAIPPKYPSRHTYDVSAACYAGTWRIVVAIRGAIQGHGFTYDRASDTVNVSTSQCAKRF